MRGVLERVTCPEAGAGAWAKTASSFLWAGPPRASVNPHLGSISAAFTRRDPGVSEALQGSSGKEPSLSLHTNTCSQV